jgi:cytosine/adenosine deaminase-related metal-dependent hydrolase
MIRYRAEWVVPISQPTTRDGWVAVEDGRIASSGAGRGDVDLGRVALMPGLVNAHTHLELSYLKNQIAPSSDFVSWIRGVVAHQRRRHASSPEIVQGIEDGIAECLASGTALAGDISNTRASVEPLTRSRLAAVVFNEIIRFRAPDSRLIVEEAIAEIRAWPSTDLVRTSLAAHAPYSVSPGIFRALGQSIEEGTIGPCAVHLSESAAEVEFIRTGKGPWREFLEEVGAWDPAWAAPGTGPVEYLDRHEFLGARVLAVHGVQMTASDLTCLAARGTTLVTCPRSNIRTGAGAPPIDRFYASGVRVAVGTDSLASTPDLNLFSELAAMRELAPRVPAAALLDSATRQGARALGFGEDFGSIESGKRARLLAVTVPAGVEDVEEYLVSGVRPELVKWIAE